MDEDQGRENKEESELTHLREGQVCVYVRDHEAHKVAEEQNNEQALGIEMQGCSAAGSIDACHSQSREE